MSDAESKCTCYVRGPKTGTIYHRSTCPERGENAKAQMTGLESLRFALQRSRRVMELLAAGDISEHEAIEIVTRIVDEVL